MAETLSENYWSDVRRWCGELLAGEVIDRSSIWFIGSETQMRSWPGPERHSTSKLEVSKITYLGGLIRWDKNVLQVLSPIEGIREMSQRVIIFSPNREVITCAYHNTEYSPPETPTDIETFSEIIDDFKAGRSYDAQYDKGMKHMKKMGLHIPGAEDYDALHAELQRGIADKYPAA